MKTVPLIYFEYLNTLAMKLENNILSPEKFLF